MKSRKMLLAALTAGLVIIGMISAAYFWHRNPSVPQENDMLPEVSQASQNGAGQQENSGKTETKNQVADFSKYIDFAQNGQGEITENGAYVNNKYKFVLHVPKVWKGNYHTEVLDMTNEDAVVAYISFMYTFKDGGELLGKIVVADRATWEIWEKSQMMTMPEVIARTADRSIVYGISTVEENPFEEGSEAYNKFESMRIRDIQMAKELFALLTD